jgi:hypothetical protein
MALHPTDTHYAENTVRKMPRSPDIAHQRPKGGRPDLRVRAMTARPIFIVGDEPMTCPMCGVRSTWCEVPNNPRQQHHDCPSCDFMFTAEPSEEFIAYGSHGRVHANIETGLAIFTDDTEGSDEYDDITKFDVTEYEQHYGSSPIGEIDILRLGYWYTPDDETKYEPAIRERPDGSDR